MDEKRVKHLIKKIEQIREEIVQQETDWKKENDGSEFGNLVHHSCIDSMGHTADHLDKAKGHLEAIVS